MTPTEHLDIAARHLRMVQPGLDYELNLMAGQLHALIAIAQILRERT